MELEYAPEGSTNLVTLRNVLVFFVEVQLTIRAAWDAVVVVVVNVVDGGVDNTYALTGLEVNLYAKGKDHVSHLNAFCLGRCYRTRARPKVRPVAIVGSRASGAGGGAKKGEPSASNCRRVSGSQGNEERIRKKRTTYDLTHLDGVCFVSWRVFGNKGRIESRDWEKGQRGCWYRGS